METEVTVLVIPVDADAPAELRRIRPDLATMQELVGGDIEPLQLDPDTHMYFNESGRLENLPANGAATRLVYLYNPGLAPHDFIVGPAFILGTRNAAGEDDGAEHNLPDPALLVARKAGVPVIDRT